MGDSETSFDNIEDSLSSLENILQVDTTVPIEIAQIPAMMRDLIAATQNPQLVTPQEGLAQFSDLI